MLDAFDSNWIAPLGPHVDAFEREFAEMLGVPAAAALSSGTAALHLALVMLGVGPGDEIIVPSHTAFPTLEPLIHLGARPVFVDVDDTYVMDLEQVAAAITPRTVGVIPVYIYGHPEH